MSKDDKIIISFWGVGCSGEGTSGGGSDDAKDTPSTTPVVPQTVAGSGKKRRGTHKRLGSSGKNGQDEDDECFEVIQKDNSSNLQRSWSSSERWTLVFFGIFRD